MLFADLLSLHLVTFLMFLFLLVVLQSKYMAWNNNSTCTNIPKKTSWEPPISVATQSVSCSYHNAQSASVHYGPILHTCYRTPPQDIFLFSLYMSTFWLQLKNATVSLTHQEEYNLSVLALEDGSEVFHLQSISGGGTGMRIVSLPVLELDSCLKKA